MPAADELFRTTAGNGTLVREAREAHGEDGAGAGAGAERPGRERGHTASVAAANTVGSGGSDGSVSAGGTAGSAPGTKGSAKAVPAPAASADQAGSASASASTSMSASTSRGQTSAAVSGEPASPAAAPTAPAQTAPPAPSAPARKVTAPRRPSGRERHDEKITVYVSPDELLGLEHARIMLRGEYGLAVDRGRIVREAVAALLADLDARGRDSILVKRLSAGG
ncbi:hypothetical protein [Catenulispora sp. GP43]|uniref:hypothetical protein n=1 Tax=Catenulispora sp. GP43 TaxID=3156263 RepID=UPI003517B364